MKKYTQFAIAFIFCLSFISQAFATPSVSVIFVLDESGSVSSSEFNLETQGFLTALGALPLDSSIEVSVVGFASFSNTIIDRVILNSSTLQDVELGLQNNPRSGGSTNLTGALNLSSSILANSAAPTRVICLATDGEPNSESNAETAAANARAAGINLSPIGIGLNSTGESFLNSIASNPPIPNPSNFVDFATVVTNVCVGATASALNISLTPNPVDFGIVDGIGGADCDQRELINFVNNSNQPAIINSITIEGEDAGAFTIESIFGLDPSQINFPISIPAFFNSTIEVRLTPNLAVEDGTYDGSVRVSGEDANGVTGDFFATLQAPEGAACITTALNDATAVVQDIDANGGLLSSTGVQITETDLTGLLNGQTAFSRQGLVADGNAKLFVTAETSILSGTMRFELIDSDVTEARLSTLSTNSASTFVDVDLVNVNGLGQATAVINAGERFLGARGEANREFTVMVCVLDDQGNCSATTQTQSVRERRAPVTLIHGLWSDNSAWGQSRGVRAALTDENYLVGFFNYDSDLGPSETMTATETGLTNVISRNCVTEMRNGYACTRNDIVGHSMGGLVARQYIQTNNSYRSPSNFNQGSVRRLVTLGTPHLGSGLASLLRFINSDINNCITDNDQVAFYVRLLNARGLEVRSAIDDLTLSSQFLVSLNNNRQQIPTHAVIGDTGNDLLGLDFLFERTGCTHDDLFRDNNGVAVNSDQVVSVFSAQGNVSDSNVTFLPGVEHVGMGTNPMVVEIVRALLRAEMSTFDSQASLSPQKSTIQIAANPSIKPNKNTEKSWLTATGELLQQVVLGVLGINSAHAQDTASAVLQSDVDDITPPGTVNFTVTVTGGPFDAVILTDGENFRETDDTQPFEFSIDFDTESSGAINFFALAITGTDIIRSNDLSVTVRPDVTQLQSLLFNPGNEIILNPGTETQLVVEGLFADGFIRNLTQSALATVYSENIVDGFIVTPGDSPVISVNAEGVVTGLQPGTAEVVATNNNITAVQRITVLAVSANDADGDGVSDNIEQQIGSNIFNPDSDNDGVEDGEEIIIDANNNVSAPDMDANGIVDVLDDQLLLVRLFDGLRVGLQTSSGIISNTSAPTITDLPDLSAALAQDFTPSTEPLGFTVENLAEGETITVNLFFNDRPDFARFVLKYGLQQPGLVNGWYLFDGAVIQGNQVTLTLTDNQLGDSDTELGVIADPMVLALGPNSPPAIISVTVNTVANTGLFTGTVAVDDPDGDIISYTAATDTLPPGLTFNADGSYALDTNNPQYTALEEGETTTLVVDFVANGDQAGPIMEQLTIIVSGSDSDDDSGEDDDSDGGDDDNNNGGGSFGCALSGNSAVDPIFPLMLLAGIVIILRRKSPIQ